MSDIYAIAQPPRIPTAEPPLLVLLHGFGSNEHDLMGLAPHLDGRLHIVSARAINDIGFGYAWYYLYGVPGNLQHDDASRTRSLEVLTEFIGNLPSKIGLATKQIYLLGFSQGAVMSLNVALTVPHLVRGVIAISGYLDEQVVPRIQPEMLSDLDILVMHGTMDDLIPVSKGRQIRDYLKNTSVRLDYQEYPVGHGIHPDALRVIQQWLANQIDHDDARHNDDDV